MANYEIEPSAQRIKLGYSLAIERFIETFGDDIGVHTMRDIGPHLTCSETEVFADLLAAHGQHNAADWLRRGHVEEDDDDDLDHNTGEYPEEGDRR